MKGRNTTSTPEKLIVGYLRVSSVDQVRDGESLPRQEAKIRSYCQLKGLGEPTIIADEGLSGFKESRPGFQRLIDLCKQGKVRTVVVYDLSRLSRSVRTTLAFIEDLIQKHGIAFVSLSQDIDTESPHGRAFLTLISVFNQLYRDEIAFKTKVAIQHKRAKGQKYSGEVPYGFADDGDGNLIADTAEQKLIQRVQVLYAQGLSTRKIATLLESEGVRTKHGHTKWASQTILNLIKRGANHGG